MKIKCLNSLQRNLLRMKLNAKPKENTAIDKTISTFKVILAGTKITEFITSLKFHNNKPLNFDYLNQQLHLFTHINEALLINMTKEG